MKQAPYNTDHNPPDGQFEPDSDAGPKSIRSSLHRWLKHFALYLGAVAVACATAIFFLWQIPILQDLPQLVKSVSDPQAVRSTTATVGPSIFSGNNQTVFPQSPSQAPPSTAEQQTTPVDATLATTSPPTPAAETPGDPNTPPPPPEQATVPIDSQADSSAPLAEAPVEDAATAPPPQTEIEQLLTDAQQQMESKRLTSPASGNALRSYQRVLELEPNNTAATDGIQRISAYYQNIAQQSLSRGRTDESLAYINRGLRAAPNNAALLSLRKEARLAKQREEQQRQASLLEERQRQETESPQEPSYRQPLPQPSSQRPWWQRQQQQQPYSNESGFNQR
ncbi:MAG TPA: hypothetical protein PKY50_00835 [Candidatus Competibacter sp.]|nr:hypothetical protein [Candidatus Competibacter sp.]